MHLPTAQARESVFYRYAVHPAARPSAQAAGSVVIIGAGPIGLVTALDLARFGVRSVILEQERQVSHGSRAIVLTRRSLEILQQVGLDEPFLKKGLPWSQGRSFYRGQEVYRMLMPHDPDDRFLPALNLQQQYIEQFLVEFCEASPLIELCWGQKVVALRQDEREVVLRVDSADGEYDVHAPWVVAADGGRSAIRKLMDLRMEGRAYAGNFVIADIQADVRLPTERLCYFDPAWNPGNNVLVHRQPDGIWRIDFRLPDGESPEQALEPALLARRIDAVLEMIGHPVQWRLDWATVYSASTLTLPSYVHGRVLFTGDAAHLLPIFGVRGANTGLQDCNNLAWKLAFAVRGWASAAILDSYSSERVRAAREICEEAGKSTRFMTPPSRGTRLMRDAVLSFSLSEEFCKDLMHWRTSRPHDYPDSPLNSDALDDQAFPGGLSCGQPARNVHLADGSYLFDRWAARSGFHLVCFLGSEPPHPSFAQIIAAARRADCPVIVTVVGTGPVPPAAPEADLRVADEDGRMHARYAARAGSAYLLRPDMHVCARWLSPTPAKVTGALRIATARAIDCP